MKTVTEQLRDMAEQVKATALNLLRTHSGIRHRPAALGNVPSNSVVVLGPDHYWNPLDEPGRQLQSKLRSHYEKLFTVLSTLLRSQARSTKNDLVGHARAAREVINQEGATWLKTIDEAVAQFGEAIDRQVALLSGLHDGAEGGNIFVPDTNALLYHPQLEDWEFDGSTNFVVVLTPTVLSELDHLKVNHRNEDVRRKAEGLICRIKGYRSRGRLADGVPLRNNRSTLMTIAVEPQMDESLPWLQADNNDDPILAGFIEVMRASTLSGDPGHQRHESSEQGRVCRSAIR
jgi:hypothetical protein